MTNKPMPSNCARARVADLMITLAKKSTAFGEITILKSRARDSHVYCQGDWWQSEADRNGVSLAAYVHAIYALLAQSQAQQILMIGCGGGTLGTMLAAANVGGLDAIGVELSRKRAAKALRLGMPTASQE